MEIIIQRRSCALSSHLEILYMTSYLTTLADGAASIYEGILCCFETTFVCVLVIMAFSRAVVKNSVFGTFNHGATKCMYIYCSTNIQLHHTWCDWNGSKNRYLWQVKNIVGSGNLHLHILIDCKSQCCLSTKKKNTVPYFWNDLRIRTGCCGMCLMATVTSLMKIVLMEKSSGVVSKINYWCWNRWE